MKPNRHFVTYVSKPLGPPYCDKSDPSASPDAEAIRCGFQPDHDGPHGWDLDGLKTERGLVESSPGLQEQVESLCDRIAADLLDRTGTELTIPQFADLSKKLNERIGDLVEELVK